MPHLDHLRYRRYVDAFVDGELDGSLRVRVADHIARCARCSHAAELTVDVKRSLARRGMSQRTLELLRVLVRRDPT